MPPTGGETGRRNLKLGTRLCLWNEQSGLGEAFDSSTGFKLPNGAIRAPDAAWVRRDRWLALTPEQRQKFVPLCPDFEIELRSPSDELEDAQAKMREYQNNSIRKPKRWKSIAPNNPLNCGLILKPYQEKQSCRDSRSI